MSYSFVHQTQLLLRGEAEIALTNRKKDDVPFIRKEKQASHLIVRRSEKKSKKRILLCIPNPIASSYPFPLLPFSPVILVIKYILFFFVVIRLKISVPKE